MAKSARRTGRGPSLGAVGARARGPPLCLPAIGLGGRDQGGDRVRQLRLWRDGRLARRRGLDDRGRGRLRDENTTDAQLLCQPSPDRRYALPSALAPLSSASNYSHPRQPPSAPGTPRADAAPTAARRSHAVCPLIGDYASSTGVDVSSYFWHGSYSRRHRAPGHELGPLGTIRDLLRGGDRSGASAEVDEALATLGPDKVSRLDEQTKADVRYQVLALAELDERPLLSTILGWQS